MKPVIIHITYQPIYKYEGWVFEYYRTKPFPPWPLKKDYSPRARAGRNFWKMIGGFSLLTIDEQEKLRI